MAILNIKKLSIFMNDRNYVISSSPPYLAGRFPFAVITFADVLGCFFSYLFFPSDNDSALVRLSRAQLRWSRTPR